MNDFKPNSHKHKEENRKTNDKKIEKVVKGTVKTKKKNQIQKLAGNILSEDARTVKSYILMDVLVPSIKDAIEDIVTNGIRMLLRGETGVRSRGSSGISKISYNKAYESRNRRNSSPARRPVGYNLDDIILDSRGEAEEVLSHMDDLIETYGIVSVADLYDLVGYTEGTYNDNKWGWTNIRTAEPIRVGDGYLLKLPRVCPID